MGLRGPGAGRQKKASSIEPSKRLRKFPWLSAKLSRAQRVIAFLEWLPVTKGKLQGKKMKLLPEQKTFIENVYGPTQKNGLRLIKLAIQSEPKGNGKTGMTAGLCLCHLFGPESEPRGEVYSAAIDREQAGIMFSEMEAIILEVPEFAIITNIQRFTKRIEVLVGPAKGSKFESLSSDARGAHGRAPSFWVYDELAQAKDRRLLDNLMQGMSKRNESLGVVLSTQAPNDEHPLSVLIDDGLSGVDPTVYVQLICAPSDADPFSEETLKACNPAWGKFLDIEDLMSKAKRAKRIPSEEPGFRNLRLNQRVYASSNDVMLTASVWNSGDAAPLIRRGAIAYGGLDLSGRLDLTSFTLVFPSGGTDQTYGILQYFWTPEGALEGRRPAEEDLFRLWIRQGYLEAIPGPVIRYSHVAMRLGEICSLYDVQGIAYDRWRIEDLKLELKELDLDLPLIPWGQGFKDMSPAIEKTQELALAGKLFHGGHPVLRSCIANARVVRDPAGNVKIDKSKTPEGAVRIDGAVTLAMAVGLMSKEAPVKPKYQAFFLGGR